MATVREVAATPNGWASWIVSAKKGDTITAAFTATGDKYGWCVIGTEGYEWLTKAPTFYPKWPQTLTLVAPYTGKFRIGASIRGPVAIRIEVSSPVTVANRWPADRSPVGPTSIWRMRVEDAPLAARNDEFMADVRRQVAASAGGVMYFNGWQYNIPRYLVSGSVARVRVKFRDEQRKGYTPWQLFEKGRGEHFVDVPLTPEMVPAVGTDSSLSVWCPDTDQLWCFWRLRLEADGTWSAVWGGRIDKISTSTGIYPDGMGTAATGVSTEVGCIGIDEARAGVIDHALSLTLMDCAPWWVFVWPAQRSDGNGKSPVPEGTRLRLDPAVDVEALKLSPLGKMVALAAQRYGFIVTDKSGGSITLAAEANRDPGTGDVWSTILGKYRGWDVFKGFPWEHMQVIDPSFGRRP